MALTSRSQRFTRTVFEITAHTKTDKIYIYIYISTKQNTTKSPPLPRCWGEPDMVLQVRDEALLDVVEGKG